MVYSTKYHLYYKNQKERFSFLILKTDISAGDLFKTAENCCEI